jgi:hypothetical protein
MVYKIKTQIIPKKSLPVRAYEIIADTNPIIAVRPFKRSALSA